MRTPEVLTNNGLQFIGENNGDWIIKSLGDPEVSLTTENGQEMYIVTFKYAVFPQKSGELVLPAAVFESYYVTYDNGRQIPGGNFFNDAFSFSSMFGQRHPVRLQTRPLAVEVGKIPAENNGNWWLPVSGLSLTSDWQRQMPEFKSGEAVKREIYLTASGALENQLPQIDFPDIPGVRQYPEKPQYASEVRDGKINSLMKVTNVYIPEQTGRIVIPEIAVSWYNVDTGKMEKALLPATEVRVWPGKEPEVPAVVPAVAAPSLAAGQPAVSGELPAATVDNSYWIWLAVGGAFGLGIALSYFWFRPRVEAAAKADAPVCSDIQLAVRNNNLHEARDSVLDWGRQEYGVTNLHDLAERVGNREFAAGLESLNRALYSGKAVDFDLAGFADLFKQVSRKQTKKKKEDNILPSLYR